MTLDSLLLTLGYSERPDRFLRSGTAEFRQAQNFGHIFRQAARSACSLKGVYQLRPPEGGGPAVPVVYVCEAKDDLAARRIHRLVWNQDIVPFVLVHTPRGVRLYSGFEFVQSSAGSPNDGLLGPLIEFNEVHEQLAALTAESIDSGRIWQQSPIGIRPEARIYWRLLGSLRKLDRWLRDHGLQSQRSRHALIGKYVYLHYLQGRKILSAERLSEWEIERESIFGRKASVKGLAAVTARLDAFLNGRVFPLKFRGPDAPKDEHVQRVAAAFAGDEFSGDQTQLHLDFQAYDFSYIPIETLSMIYEQFLHMPETVGAAESDDATEGREAGAYYTPIPVVNFMLAELDEHRPLHRGVTVFDPSCGSGAFLVQCYRKLIERSFPAGRKKPTPYDLKKLLKDHIFGSDMDEDACSVAEFSLVLTLLDYVTPPDLLEYPRFKLPDLRNQNIFHSDFFDERLRSPSRLGKKRFHWVVGNPPWKRLETTKLKPRDQRAMKWMQDHEATQPVGKYSLSQAFTWRCAEFLHPKGQAALLLPAMTLFEDVSQEHRRAFFRQCRVLSIANYSNFARVLFKGRAEVPAAALCFGLRGDDPNLEETTAFFSPLIANQEQNRPAGPGERNEVWSIVINGNEIRDVRYAEIEEGKGLPWKLAMWGSPLDDELMKRMSRKWYSIRTLESKWNRKDEAFRPSEPHQILGISEGLQLRSYSPKAELDPVDEVVGEMELLVSELAGARNVFSIPAHAQTPVSADRAFARKGRAKLPLAVCRPPHVIVGAARNYAVFSDEFVVVPPRQIGVASPTSNSRHLKALALYLSSDFATYHQFFHSTQQGIKFEVATLDCLRELPCPIYTFDDQRLDQWCALHDALAVTRPRGINDDDPRLNDNQPALLEQLNRLVAQALGLTDRDQALVHDLVHIRLALNDGQVRPAAMNPPSRGEVAVYAEWLQRELNDFVGDDSPEQHSVSVVYDDRSGFVAVELAPTKRRTPGVQVLAADAAGARELQRTRQNLRTEHAQWVYFDRDLKIFQGRNTYLFKPMERFHWTRTQAMLDAAEIIGDTLASAD